MPAIFLDSMRCVSVQTLPVPVFLPRCSPWFGADRKGHILDTDKKPQASAAWLAALLRAQAELLQVIRAEDLDYLNSLIDGSGDLLAEDTFTRMEPMFAKYEDDAAMMDLLTRAAEVYGDAATAAVYWVFAADAITNARRKQELM